MSYRRTQRRHEILAAHYVAATRLRRRERQAKALRIATRAGIRRGLLCTCILSAWGKAYLQSLLERLRRDRTR